LFIQDALNQLQRDYTMVMIAQRLFNCRRTHWIILLQEGPGRRAKFPGGTPGGRLPLAKLHGPENNELGSDVSETR
jgi:hypothetical protein